MKVFYSPYILHPLKRLNRLSSMDPKKGVHLKAVLGDKVMFADYFPHLPLGDRSTDQFLEEFKFQKYEYDQKVFDLLLRDSDFLKSEPKVFKNHQLWTGSEPLEGNVVKYKLLHDKDRSFMMPLEKGHRLRLDGNALFRKKDFDYFIESIPRAYLKQIEYIEDPLLEKDWSDLSLPRASDFIEGSEFEYYIYKPNCEFKPKIKKKLIFSAYLGSDLGNWHTYCELMKDADLSLTHGIIARDFYEEETNFFLGSFNMGFKADMEKVKSVYKGLYQKEWKLLCSM